MPEASLLAKEMELRTKSQREGQKLGLCLSKYIAVITAKSILLLGPILRQPVASQMWTLNSAFVKIHFSFVS